MSGFAVSAALVEQRLVRPPKRELIVDIAVTNDRDRPRWCLLPATLPKATDGGVFAVETASLIPTRPPGLTPTSTRPVLLGHFLGRGGFQALLLPPSGSVRLRRLRIAAWGSQVEPLEIILAAQVAIGDEDIAEWFPERPEVEAGADVGESGDLVWSRRNKDFQEVPVFPRDPEVAAVALGGVPRSPTE